MKFCCSQTQSVSTEHGRLLPCKRALGGRGKSIHVKLRLALVSAQPSKRGLGSAVVEDFGRYEEAMPERKIDAVVSSLFGRPRWGHSNCVVPMLGPESGLPFGLSLEIIKDVERPLTPSSSQETARGRLLDLCYVLCGNGQICSDDGSCRNLRPGDALLAWHGTTNLTKHGSEPLSVLRFHLPVHLVTRSSPGPSVVLTTDELRELIGAFNQRHSTSEGDCFSPGEAHKITQTAKAQASKGISKLYRDREGEEAAEADITVAGSNLGLLLPDVLHIDSWTGGKQGLKAKLQGLMLAAGFMFPSGSRSSNSSSSSSSNISSSNSNSSNSHSNSSRGSVSCGSSSGASVSHAISNAASKDTSFFASSAAFEGVGSSCLLMQRAMEHFRAFRFPHQTNRLAFVFDPSEINLSVSFGIEVFEPGHLTPIHVHPNAHEVFFVLAGHGVATCDGERIPVSPGDVIAFPPRSKHAIDNLTSSKLYCLQLMAPNEQFVEYVKTGEPIGRLSDDDLCTLANVYC